MNLTGDRRVLDAILDKAEDFLANDLPVDLGNPSEPTPDFRVVEHPWIEKAREDMLKSNPVRDEGIVVSTQVAYVGEGGRMYDVGEQVKGSTSVVSHYLTTGYMWDVIRAKVSKAVILVFCLFEYHIHVMINHNICYLSPLRMVHTGHTPSSHMKMVYLLSIHIVILMHHKIH